ncbi:MAG: UDP-N-acetylglucosamine 1-carboxyvinyltransferase [Phycisphaeraceae bacterium]|nr:UDP-N-acetylglucosamine 1-carboxyvinyltransferase [Phycisphaeraceae bacterium]MCW5753682.1 UDP-N-acetylglucosamine 1-carboxyvinyltransferase [Phycisphaeraceae bacterium]
MDVFVIEGGRRLDGTLRINGAKNAALPLMSAALLSDEPITLLDVPALADTRNMLRLLAELGCHRVNESDGPDATRVVLHSFDRAQSHARYDIVRTMRAGICVLGPLLGRRGEARVSMPGGCTIGDRPVDLHLRGLRALGADIQLAQGDIFAKAPGGRLRGARVFLGGPMGSTVLGTINVLAAATLARGETIIESAACEPEVVDMARLLTAMGAKISGAGSPRIVIEGVDSLGSATHAIVPDRIEAGTFMCAAAITNGDIVLENCPIDGLMSVIDRLEAVGVRFQAAPGQDPMHSTCRVTSSRVLQPVEVTTQPHPGFPTDLQAQIMALLCLADGNSVVTEKIFPERFMHVAELARMGARIHRHGSTAVISGVKRLIGAPVMASDLRASAGLVLAGLAAEGTTIVNRVYHIDRGYERMEERLGALGARIERVDEKEVE